MLKVLINAYAICPGLGSEAGMGWNWCLNLANHCELYIITEEEFRDKIESTVPTLMQGKNMHFFYIPVTEDVRRMCWNQGDWRFYWYYRKWQKNTYKLAKTICGENKIDLVHQLNMVTFREPGYLWKLGIPFIWGPIGGIADDVPKCYLERASWKLKSQLYLKNYISTLQLLFSPRIHKTIKHTSTIIAAVPAVKNKIKKIKHRDSIWIPETGCYNQQKTLKDKREREDFYILWVGRFIYTKRLDIALRTIAEIKNLKRVHFQIVGSGDKAEVEAYKSLAANLGIDDICEWKGRIDNAKVHDMMREADVFFFTSIAEATSTVIPEAINNGLPILCFDTCGFGPLVSEKIGIKIPLSTPNNSVKEFAQSIIMLYKNRQRLYEMSKNCSDEIKKLLWEDKATRMVQIYEKCLGSV